MADPKRKIPYNYTSADDDRIIRHLFGSELLKVINTLEQRKETGRSSRLLHRFMGDLFIIQRNPFLFQELVEYPGQRRKLFAAFQADLDFIHENAKDHDVEKVYNACREKLDELQRKIATLQAEQSRIKKHLRTVIGKDNIYFDPFNLTAHATDATDWRMFLPVAVLRPDHASQVPLILQKVQALGFNVIPRGGGTGLTGGATPLSDRCVMINTEKLNRIGDIEYSTTADGREFASLYVEAGVITQDAIDFARSKGYIFATDPTSAWACTIGGNVAENAGGKQAVLFGTAIDNLLGYTIVMPDSRVYAVQRLNHPLRKIHPEDRVEFEITDLTNQESRMISLSGEDIRKKDLGKDVTNKALNGLYGIQKEGCDGIITDARFVLYPEFKFKKTFCVEFFGTDMSQASQVITRITHAFKGRDPSLSALEHFDYEYAKAIKYKAKTSKGSTIIAVLLIDMVSNDQDRMAAGASELRALLADYDKTGFSEARDKVQAERFWQDRKRLGAIASHTNAFKLNEDIVLPIDALADFARFVDQENLGEQKINQVQVIEDMLAELDEIQQANDRDLLNKRIGQVKNLAFEFKKKLNIASKDAIEARIHAKNFLKESIHRLQGYTDVVAQLQRCYAMTESRRIVIATHMHAGDGNVHVNIPVLSNDRQMMQRANQAADRVMEKACELKGVVSGEHGIGITKFKHQDPAKIEAFNKYRDEVDPKGLMNPGKLKDLDVLEKVFTTSFNLLEVEARILEYGSLSDLALKIANCVRCGRCKPKCPVFYPAKNMFFHPRNKNLSLIALIEALLYISQRNQSTAFKILKNIEEIADHCTICHKCLEKCPVNIDSGVISIEERDILGAMAFKQKPAATQLTLSYLGTRQPLINPVLRTALLGAGSRLQRTASSIVSRFVGDNGAWRPLKMLKTPVARQGLKTLRSILPATRQTEALVIDPPGQTIKTTVFYFPGCGSERVFSNISMASLYLLLDNQVRVILPPPYRCCGYPFQVNAKKALYNTVVVENSIMFSRIREMFSDLSFDACLVSCGTCMEALEKLDADQVFGSRITDISNYMIDQGIDFKLSEPYLYHEPCHDSLRHNAPDLLNSFAVDQPVRPVPFCCSEAGTLALSRPDISHAMLDRKKHAIETLKPVQGQKILTNCPSCLQGLGRLESSGIRPVHLAEELAVVTGGKEWKSKLIRYLDDFEIVPF